MADEWRVELDVEDHDAFHRALDRLRERGVAREARHRLGDDVSISVDAERIFAYVPTPEQAHEAATVLTELAQSHHLSVHATIARWDAQAEQWEPADVHPPPS